VLSQATAGQRRKELQPGEAFALQYARHSHTAKVHAAPRKVTAQENRAAFSLALADAPRAGREAALLGMAGAQLLGSFGVQADPHIDMAQ
jgi:hypothetical protein